MRGRGRLLSGSTHRQGECAMAESQAHDDSRKDERVKAEAVYGKPAGAKPFDVG